MCALVDAVLARRLRELSLNTCMPPAAAPLARLLAEGSLTFFEIDSSLATGDAAMPMFDAAGAALVADALRVNTTLTKLFLIGLGSSMYVDSAFQARLHAAMLSVDPLISVTASALGNGSAPALRRRSAAHLRKLRCAPRLTRGVHEQQRRRVWRRSPVPLRLEERVVSWARPARAAALAFLPQIACAACSRRAARYLPKSSDLLDGSKRCNTQLLKASPASAAAQLSSGAAAPFASSASGSSAAEARRARAPDVLAPWRVRRDEAQQARRSASKGAVAGSAACVQHSAAG